MIVSFAILIKIVQLSSRNPCYMLIIWGKGQTLIWVCFFFRDSILFLKELSIPQYLHEEDKQIQA